MANTTHQRSLAMGDGNIDCGNTINSFNKTVVMSDEDREIMHWLSPLEPQNRHQGVRDDRFDGVGDWLLETNEFQKWRGGEGGVDEAVLFCYGNPGVGKTYLSSLVIDSLCDKAREEDVVVGVAGFYCDFLAHREQTITNMVGAILKQLIGKGDILNYVRDVFQEEFGGSELRLPDLMRLLKTTIAELPRVFICIDALDECPPKHLPELLNSLRYIIRGSPRTRIFLTGRPHVEADVQSVFTKAVTIPISLKASNIRSYLEMKLDRDTDPDAMSDALRADILRIIPERISEIFLLVSLNIDAILGEVTIRQRRKKLDNMRQGNGLSDAYTTTLDRLKAQKGDKSELGLKALMWVSHSERPLRANELCHALGVEIGSSDLDDENVPTLRTILACSLGLVTVEPSSSTVRLLHYTLQEYLSNNPTLFNSPHSAIAEVCLTYLDFRCIRELSPTLESAPSTMPLLEYASCHWGHHTKREMTENVKTLALRLLDGFDEHISAQLLLWHYRNSRRSRELRFNWWGGPTFTGFTGLHGAAFFGISGILTALLEMKRWSVNARDGMGGTALMWAARRGHEGVVEMLLDQDVNPTTADCEGKTPLFLASCNGNEGVVKMLLDRDDINPTAVDREGRTPLLLASCYGHEGVVKIFLGQEDVNPTTADHRGDTPLLCAARYGRAGVVQILLDQQDVNPNIADQEGRTPLLLASCYGHEGVVKILLGQEDVNPATADHRGDTPLLCAAQYGRAGVVQMLLDQQDVNPNITDRRGKTPLLWAARCGREEVVEMFLIREDVNPNIADHEGKTPLLCAAQYGQAGVVQILLDQQDVNPNIADQEGKTPLLWAVQFGYEGVAEICVDHQGVNPNLTDNEGKTPLFWAAQFGRERVVKMLLDQQDVNPNIADHEGKTPLLWAARCGHEGEVKMLLDQEDANPNTADHEGKTPLLWASRYGHVGAVKMLLDHESVNPNIADHEGKTPLSWAAQAGRTGAAKMLLGREDVNSETMDNNNQTPLSLALSKGHYQVVRLLQEREKLNSDTADGCRRHTSFSSPERWDEFAVEMQSTGDDPNPDITNPDNRPAHPSANPNKREASLNHKDSIPISADSDLPLTEPATLPQPLSNLPPMLLHSARKPDAPPHNTQSTPTIPVNRYLFIASFICVLAILIYNLIYNLPSWPSNLAIKFGFILEVNSR